LIFQIGHVLRVKTSPDPTLYSGFSNINKILCSPLTLRSSEWFPDVFPPLFGYRSLSDETAPLYIVEASEHVARLKTWYLGITAFSILIYNLIIPY
jgi:hypothetical protein